jgi:hypothetical protein
LRRWSLFGLVGDANPFGDGRDDGIEIGGAGEKCVVFAGDDDDDDEEVGEGG